ncbi:MAG: Asp23/Gls24 family envelope stress response protein [Metamycoplasmataceae bacterium]
MDISTLSDNVIKNLSTVPGILGFCNIDATNQELKDSKSWSKAVSITINDKIINLNVAIIISIDSTIKNISKQIKEQVAFSFKKNGLKLGFLNIYIKGVKKYE